MRLLLAADFEALAPIVIIVIGVLYNLIRKAVGGEAEAARDRARQKQEELRAKQQQAAGTAARQEPMLPYEELVDQMFGPYIDARKREYAARQAEQTEPGEDPEIRILEERPAPVAPAPPPRPATRAPVPMPPPVEIPGAIGEPSREGTMSRKRRRSLDEILFRNPRLNAGARLVLAAEILNRPRPGRFPRVP